MNAIIKRAHEIRREAAAKFGGKAGQYDMAIACDMAREEKMGNTTKWTAKSGQEIEVTTIPGSINVNVKINGKAEGERLLEIGGLKGPYKKAGCAAKAGRIGIFKDQLKNILKTYSPEKADQNLKYLSNYGKGFWVSNIEKAEIEGF